MKYTYWSRDKLSRLLIIAGALCIYLTLESINAFEMFYESEASFSGFWLVVSFGIFSLTSFISLAVGSLVWLYARERRIAQLVFGFSATMMVVFICLPNLNEAQLSFDFADIGVLLGVFIASVLAFYFPQDILSLSKTHLARNKTMFKGYILVSGLFVIICSFIVLNRSNFNSSNLVIII